MKNSMTLLILALVLVANVYSTTAVVSAETNLNGAALPTDAVKAITTGCFVKYKPLIEVLTPPEQDLMVAANKANTDATKCFDAATIKATLKDVRKAHNQAFGKDRSQKEKKKRTSLGCLKSGSVGDAATLTSIDTKLAGFNKEQGAFNQANAKFLGQTLQLCSMRYRFFTATIADFEKIAIIDAAGNYTGLKFSPEDQTKIVTAFQKFTIEKNTFDVSSAMKIAEAKTIMAEAFTKKGSCGPTAPAKSSTLLLRYLTTPPPSGPRPTGGSKKEMLPAGAQAAYESLTTDAKASTLTNFNTEAFATNSPFATDSKIKLVPNLLKQIMILMDGASNDILKQTIGALGDCKTKDDIVYKLHKGTNNDLVMTCQKAGAGAVCPTIVQPVLVANAILPTTVHSLNGCLKNSIISYQMIENTNDGKLSDFKYGDVNGGKEAKGGIQKCAKPKDATERTSCGQGMPADCETKLKSQCKSSGLEDQLENSPVTVSGPTECDTLSATYSEAACFTWIQTKFFAATVAFKIDVLDNISSIIATDEKVTRYLVESTYVSSTVSTTTTGDIGTVADFPDSVTIDGSTSTTASTTDMADVTTEATTIAGNSSKFLAASIMMIGFLAIFY